MVFERIKVVEHCCLTCKHWDQYYKGVGICGCKANPQYRRGFTKAITYWSDLCEYYKETRSLRTLSTARPNPVQAGIAP